MTTRTGTMSPFYSDEHLEPSHLLRKVILLFLLVAAFALGLTTLFREKHDYPILYQKAYADISMALVAGFGSRFIIRNQPNFVRGLAAVAAYITGLYLLGYMSDWKYGIGPLVFWPKEVDWDGLAQLGIGVFLCLLIFRSWRRAEARISNRGARPSRAVPVNRSEHSPDHSLPDSPTPYTWPSFGRSSDRRVSVPSSSRAAVSSHTAVRSRPRVTRMKQPLVVRKPAKSRRKGLFGSKPSIQLAVVEEHRCPYCLEIVNRKDPRGTVECDVCHTLHHKDCWEITGTCQVPHLNT